MISTSFRIICQIFLHSDDFPAFSSPSLQKNILSTFRHKIMRKIILGTLLLISSSRIIWQISLFPSRGFRFFSSLFLIKKVSTSFRPDQGPPVPEPQGFHLFTSRSRNSSKSANWPTWISLSS